MEVEPMPTALPRGGRALLDRATRTHMPLFGVVLSAEQRTPEDQLHTALRPVSRELERHGRGLLDLKGCGDCGFRCLGYALRLLGFPRPDRIEDIAAVTRAEVVAHMKLSRVLNAQLEPDSPGGADLHLGLAMISSLISWRASVDSSAELSEATYLALMARPGTYADAPSLHGAADRYGVRIKTTLVSPGGAPVGPPGVFLPLDGRAPWAEITLVCIVDTHFVLEGALQSQAATVPPLSDEIRASLDEANLQRALLYSQMEVAFVSLQRRMGVDVHDLTRRYQLARDAAAASRASEAEEAEAWQWAEDFVRQRDLAIAASTPPAREQVETAAGAAPVDDSLLEEALSAPALDAAPAAAQPDALERGTLRSPSWTVSQMANGEPFPVSDPRWCEVTASGTASGFYAYDREHAAQVVALSAERAAEAASAAEPAAAPEPAAQWELADAELDAELDADSAPPHWPAWLISDSAIAEYLSFEWPLTAVSEVQRLLRCRHIAPAALVGFEFSSAVRSALEARGIIALSVDLRRCLGGGMHATLNVYSVLPLARWERVYLFPPCFQQLRADTDCLPFKQQDGRAFFGCLAVLFCMCVVTPLLVVEQPDTIAADYIEGPFLNFRTADFGDEPNKFVRLYVRGAHLALPAASSAPRVAPPHHTTYANPEERDRDKSSWLPFVNLSAALARLSPTDEEAAPLRSFEEERERFACAWYDAGLPLPVDYHLAAPSPANFAQRAYQLVRGAGTGETVSSTEPISRQDSWAGCDYCRGGLDGPTSCLFCEEDSDDDLLASLDPPSAQPTDRPQAAAVRRALGLSTAPGDLPSGGLGASDMAQAPRAKAAPKPPTTLDLRTATANAVILVVVSVLLQPLVFAHVNGFTVLGVELPERAHRSSCLEAAQRWVGAISSGANLAFMAGEYVGGARVMTAPLELAPPATQVIRTRPHRMAALAAGVAFAWMTLASLGDTAAGATAARALVAVDAFVRPVAELPDALALGSAEPLEFRFGGSSATSLIRRPIPSTAAGTSAARAISRALAGDALLRDKLLLLGDDPLLQGWVDQLMPIDRSEIPASLLSSLSAYDSPGLETLPFSSVYVPFATAWLPRPPRQAPAPPDAPACITSPAMMMLPDTQRMVRAWLDRTLRDLLVVRDHVGETPPDRDRPPPLAIGQSELHEWARGRVWDCRGACCVVADFHADFDTHLNLDYLRRRLAAYPDQYLVANLLEGVRLDADVELQTVLVPHLTSLSKGYGSVDKELHRLHGLGWYDFFADFPFWPMYLNGQGATARKLEPDRFRRTTEGGGPRKLTLDRSGLAAISINDASHVHHMPRHFETDTRPEFRAWLAERGLPAPERTPVGGSKWHKELKPTLQSVMRDIAILRRASTLLNEPIYLFGDDAKDHFNQLAMAPSELHKLGIVFVAGPDDVPQRDYRASDDVTSRFKHLPQHDSARLVFVSELRLGFGTHGASNIAQRFSEALLAMFREDMDAADEPFMRRGLSDPLDRWLDARSAAAETDAAACQQRTSAVSLELQELVCNQHRLYFAYVFTDDPIFGVVGVERAIRALRVWRRLTDDLNLIMAIPEKRSLGSWSPWLGVWLIAALGLVVIPRHKLLRASAAITRLLSHGLPFSSYRSLCGLLEHLRAVNLRGRNVMHGLYRPHGPEGASSEGPDGWVWCDDLMRKQANRWLSLIGQSGGTEVQRAILRRERDTPASLRIVATADACHGDADPTGIAGFCHGLVWYFRIPEADLSLVTTPLLELLATIFNFVMFRDHVTGIARANASVEFVVLSDALSTALALPAESVGSPAHQEAYQQLLDTREFAELAPVSSCGHLFGDANPLSDRACRARWKEFRQLCAQLNVVPTYLELSPRCRQIYHHVTAFIRARQPTPPVTLGLTAVTGGGFFARLSEAVTETHAPPPLPRATATAPPISDTPRSGLFARLGLDTETAAATERAQAPPPPIARLTGLALMRLPPAAALTSRLRDAGAHYAQLRARALAEGPNPAMALRANLHVLGESAAAVEEYVEHGVNANTARKDQRAWEFWERVCEKLETSPLRTAEDVRDYPTRNAHLLCVLMLHAMAVCTPTDVTRRFIKPRSALAYPLAIIRIFARWGIIMPSYKALKAELQGLMRVYVQYHGSHSLAPKRAEPMKFSMMRRMVAVPSNGTVMIGSIRWDDAISIVFIFRRLVPFLMHTAFRLGEIVAHTSGEIMFITRACVTWIIGGVLYRDPTAAQLRGLRPGLDRALVAPPRSKPDQWGEIHCPFPVCLTYQDSPDNAARGILEIELERPCHGAARETTALFADERGMPYTHAKLDPLLSLMLTYLYGAAVARLYTWHSFRSGLCTALHAAGVPDAMIMLICRWMCPESLHVYRRMGTVEHEKCVTLAARADVDVIQAGNVVHVDGDQRYAALSAELTGHHSRAHAAYAAAQRGECVNVDDSAAAAAPPPPAPPPPRVAAAPPPSPAADASALTPANALHRRVLVRRDLWPRYACHERGGEGWEATIVSNTNTTAVVAFSHATDRLGRPYPDERLPLHSLVPI